MKEEGITSIYDISDDEKEEVYKMMKEEEKWHMKERYRYSLKQ
jgi:hypothetical protein